MNALFQVSLDPSLEPGDLKDNIATIAGTSHATSRTNCSGEKPSMILFTVEIKSQHTPPWHTRDNYGSQILLN